MKIKIWLIILTVMCLLLSLTCVYNYSQIRMLDNQLFIVDENALKNLNSLTKVVVEHDQKIIALTLDYFDRNGKEEAFNKLYDIMIENKPIYDKWNNTNTN